MPSIIFSSYGLILHDNVEEILCLRVTDGLEVGVVIGTMVEIEESIVQLRSSANCILKLMYTSQDY